MSETWGQELEEWTDIVEHCELSLAGISRRFEMAHANLCNWFYHGVIPSKKSKARMGEILMKLRDTKRIPYHPSYGFATQAQIDRLKQSISSYERDQIMAQIEKQTKLRGKID